MPVTDILADLLQEMRSRKASDMHIRAGCPPMMRVLGELEVSQRTAPLPPETTREIANTLMNDRQKRIFEEKFEVDLSYSLPGVGRFRGNVFNQRGTVNIAIRVVPTTVPSIEELHLPPVVKKLSERRRGLILVAGTTGCGKSTTLASMIDYINQTRKCHIITIEDPIEFLHTDKKSVVSQRELGLDTTSYTDALKHVVRQNPDVILLGEMRDLETMAAAITSAQTGHLVLSTIHTIDAVQTISRIVDMYPPHQQNQIRFQLADTLQGVISQRLVKTADGAAVMPAVEVLVVTPLVKKSIEENSLNEINGAIRQGHYYGMQTFNQCLVRLHNEGKVKLEDALAAASNPEEVMLAVRGIESGSDAGKIYGS